MTRELDIFLFYFLHLKTFIPLGKRIMFAIVVRIGHNLHRAYN